MSRCINCPNDAGARMLCEACRASPVGLQPDTRTPNGFANAETENVTLWLENYRPDYNHVRKLQSVWFTQPMNYGGDRDECLGALANAIRVYCRGRWPSLKTPDGYELAAVDWAEIASHWVEP